MADMRARGRTNTFHLLLDHVVKRFRQCVEESKALEQQDGDDLDDKYKNYMEDRHKGTVTLIKSIFGMFVPEGITQWILDFLADHPPNFIGTGAAVLDD